MKHASSAAAKDETESGAVGQNEYRGPERRRHRVYVTRNTEYHVKDGTCVAVRDRRTGAFLHGHLALQRPIVGGLKFFRSGGIEPNAGEPRPGESLYFASEGHDLVTSPLVSIERGAPPCLGGEPRTCEGRGGRSD